MQVEKYCSNSNSENWEGHEYHFNKILFRKHVLETLQQYYWYFIKPIFMPFLPCRINREGENRSTHISYGVDLAFNSKCHVYPIGNSGPLYYKGMKEMSAEKLIVDLVSVLQRPGVLPMFS